MYGLGTSFLHHRYPVYVGQHHFIVDFVWRNYEIGEANKKEYQKSRQSGNTGQIHYIQKTVGMDGRRK